MAKGDAEHWDARWEARAGAGGDTSQPLHLEALADLLPAAGRAIDLAGGSGEAACWLAQRGLDVTVADVSRVALDQAIERARAAGVGLDAMVFDADHDDFPAHTWQLAHVAHFLHPNLMDAAVAALPVGGQFVAAIGTIWNLQRHDRPSRRFLLEPGEIEAWALERLEIVHWSEAWRENDQHEAWLVAVKH